MLRRDGSLVECPPAEATHIILQLPGPCGRINLPVQPHPQGWDWNGSTDLPTIRPSLLSNGADESGPWTCHSYVTEGTIHFLADSSHPLAGQTLDLLEVETLHA